MKPHPCLEANKILEEAAARAEQRKHQAIDRLSEALGQPQEDGFHKAMVDLIEADKRALKEKGR
jgi:hypothetical protein